MYLNRSAILFNDLISILHYFINNLNTFLSIKARLPVARTIIMHLFILPRFISRYIYIAYIIYMLCLYKQLKKSCYINIIIIKTLFHYPIFIDVK